MCLQVDRTQTAQRACSHLVPCEEAISAFAYTEQKQV